MNITHVNDVDLGGVLFNGFDLHRSLRARGHQAHQLVLRKLSEQPTVDALLDDHTGFVQHLLAAVESQLGMQSMLYLGAKAIERHSAFRQADLVHYHLLHNQIVSLLDLPALFAAKSAVWTIHDPWVISGGCIHPLQCEQWMTGCPECRAETAETGALWRLKERMYKRFDADLIVASDWMEKYLRQSPLTKRFERIHKIPFGIDVANIPIYLSEESKLRLGFRPDETVVAFRNEDAPIKGAAYLIDALRQFEPFSVSVLTVGSARLPESITQRFRCVELGWSNDRQLLDVFYFAADVFVMPSLAESFGVMAIEAMAHSCAVIVFQDTVLPEITAAPECGLAVSYKDCGELHKATLYLAEHPEERKRRGARGREIVERRYRYEDYVNRHIALYQEILNR